MHPQIYGASMSTSMILLIAAFQIALLRSSNTNDNQSGKTEHICRQAEKYLLLLRCSRYCTVYTRPTFLPDVRASPSNRTSPAVRFSAQRKEYGTRLCCVILFDKRFVRRTTRKRRGHFPPKRSGKETCCGTVALSTRSITSLKLLY